MTINTEQTTPTAYVSALQGKQVSVRIDRLEGLTRPTMNQLNPKEKSTAQCLSMFDRELKSLQSYNKHGTSGSLISESRSRHRKPSLEKAKKIFQEALGTIEEELQGFQERSYEKLDLNQLVQTDLNPRYKRLRSRQYALLCSAEDLSSMLLGTDKTREESKKQFKSSIQRSPISS